MVIIGDEGVTPFHDREIVFDGIEWLRQVLIEQQHNQFCFVQELGERFR